MRLGILLQSSPGGSILKDIAPFAREPVFTTGPHGFAGFACFIAAPLYESFRIYDRPGMPHVSVNAYGASVVWEGRLEDPSVTSDGVRIGALGYWRGYTDTLYTATHQKITALTIIRALIASVAAQNAFMSAATAAVEDPGVTLLDEIYEDKRPSEILERLCQLGDNATPSRLWEVGVWDNRDLYFRPRYSQAREWRVDAREVGIERTLEALCNSTYAVYRGAGGQRLVTTTGSDTYSQARYGLVRQEAISVNTTSVTVATAARDAHLSDGKTPPVRASISIPSVYTSCGTLYPKYAVRAGDKIVVQNLPPTSMEIDRISRFYIRDTSYRIDTDELTVTPDEAPARL
jgi:hypothetical protein